MSDQSGRLRGRFLQSRNRKGIRGPISGISSPLGTVDRRWTNIPKELVEERFGLFSYLGGLTTTKGNWDMHIPDEYRLKFCNWNLTSNLKPFIRNCLVKYTKLSFDSVMSNHIVQRFLTFMLIVWQLGIGNVSEHSLDSFYITISSKNWLWLWFGLLTIFFSSWKL